MKKFYELSMDEHGYYGVDLVVGNVVSVSFDYANENSLDQDDVFKIISIELPSLYSRGESEMVVQYEISTD